MEFAVDGRLPPEEVAPLSDREPRSVTRHEEHGRVRRLWLREFRPGGDEVIVREASAGDESRLPSVDEYPSPSRFAVV